MGHPCYMYKMVEGEVLSELFDDEKIPEGWHESKFAARSANIPKKTKSKPKKPKVISNVDNSTGLDQQFGEAGGNIS